MRDAGRGVYATAKSLPCIPTAMPRPPKSAQGKTKPLKKQGEGQAGENPRKRKLSHADAPTHQEKKQRTKQEPEESVKAARVPVAAKKAAVKRAVKADAKVLREPKAPTNVLSAALKSNKAAKAAKKESKEALETPRDELLSEEQARSSRLPLPPSSSSSLSSELSLVYSNAQCRCARRSRRCTFTLSVRPRRRRRLCSSPRRCSTSPWRSPRCLPSASSSPGRCTSSISLGSLSPFSLTHLFH